jgi:hypothetical protein
VSSAAVVNGRSGDDPRVNVLEFNENTPIANGVLFKRTANGYTYSVSVLADSNDQEDIDAAIDKALLAADSIEEAIPWTRSQIYEYRRLRPQIEV